MTRYILRRRYVYGAMALLAVALVYYAWTEVTQRRGAQRVTFHAANQTCGTAGPLRYCVYTAAGGTNGDIVYWMHGRNLGPDLWNDDTYLTAMIQAEWQRTGASVPTVVAVSYGPVWLLTPKGARANSGLLDDFMGRLPDLEEKIGRPRRRLLLGESMGGLNVLVAGLSHPAHFAKVAALCPGVYATSPFAPLATIRTAMERTGAHPKVAFGIWRLGKSYIANDAEWRRMSPLALIERAGPHYPAFYLSNGLYDAYGNFEGTERLAKMAAQRGVRTEWHPLYGGHCASDIPSLAAFLTS